MRYEYEDSKPGWVSKMKTRRQYVMIHDDDFYLHWTQDSNIACAIDDEWFPFTPFRPFISDRNDSFPYPLFLFTFINNESHIERVKILYEETVSTLSLSKGILDQHQLLELICIRDALEKQLQRSAEQLGSVLDSMKGILKVWLFEAATYVSEGVHRDQKARPADTQDIKDDFALIWRRLTSGRRATEIRQLLEHALNEHSVPVGLAELQRDGLVAHLKYRDAILDVALRLYGKLTVYETFVYHALPVSSFPEDDQGN